MIVVTGMGSVSALGPDVEAMASALASGTSGIRPAEKIDMSGSSGGLLAEAKDFDPKKFIPPMAARRMSRFSRLALSSAVQAVKDSGLEVKDPFRVGVIVGTGLASTESTDSFYESLLKGGPLEQNPMVFPETVQNIAASQIAIHFGIKGPNTTFSNNETSAELALYYSMGLLMGGKVDAVIVAAAEELNPAVIRGFRSLHALTHGKMRPFDKNRDGYVLGEGAGAVVLERKESAVARGAKIHAELISVGFSSIPVERLRYDTSGKSMAHAMRAALEASGVDKVDMVSASANASVDLDPAEAKAIKEVLGNNMHITAMRGYTGVFMADGINRLIAAIISLNSGHIPPILGLESPVIDLPFVTGKPVNKSISTVLVNSFSNGGSAASVVLKAPSL